jgi:hypothetical protein
VRYGYNIPSNQVFLLPNAFTLLRPPGYNGLQHAPQRVDEHQLSFTKLPCACLHSTERFCVPLLRSDKVCFNAVAWIGNLQNTTVARLPTQATGVAELVLASAGHVVAAARDQVDDLLASLTALPASIVGQLEGLLFCLVWLEKAGPGVGHGSARGAGVGTAEWAPHEFGTSRCVAEEMRARWLSAIQALVCRSVELFHFLLEADFQIFRKQGFYLLPRQDLAAPRRV